MANAVVNMAAFPLLHFRVSLHGASMLIAVSYEWLTL